MNRDSELLDQVRRGQLSSAELNDVLNSLASEAKADPASSGQQLVALLDAAPSLRATISTIVLNSHDADDALQETLLAVTHSLPSFRGDASVLTWANGIARNKAKDVLRRKGRPASPDPMHNLPTEHERFTSQWATRTDVEEALSQLSDKLRDVFELADIEGFTYDEIANKLEIERNTVASRLRRARAQLQLTIATSAR